MLKVTRLAAKALLEMDDAGQLDSGLFGRLRPLYEKLVGQVTVTSGDGGEAEPAGLQRSESLTDRLVRASHGRPPHWRVGILDIIMLVLLTSFGLTTRGDQSVQDALLQGVVAGTLSAPISASAFVLGSTALMHLLTLVLLGKSNSAWIYVPLIAATLLFLYVFVGGAVLSEETGAQLLGSHGEHYLSLPLWAIIGAWAFATALVAPISFLAWDTARKRNPAGWANFRLGALIFGDEFLDEVASFFVWVFLFTGYWLLVGSRLALGFVRSCTMLNARDSTRRQR